MKRTKDLQDKNWQKKLRQSFIKDGFIFLPSFLNEQEIEEVKRKVNGFIKEKVPSMPREMVFYEDKTDQSTLKQIQKLFEFDDFFRDMMFDSRFELLASILLDDKVEGKNMQYFNKPPRIGQGTPPHQDGYYFMLEPNEAVTMWMALEEVDEENGCVRYVRGSHRKGIRPHGKTNVLGFSQGITDFGIPEDHQQEAYFPTKAGDLLVHHSLTIHWADPNKSESRTRQALGFIYYAANAREDEKAHEAYAKKLAEEMARSGKI